MNYETIKQNYVRGIWTLEMLKMAYKRGLITLDQYKEIKAAKEE